MIITVTVNPAMDKVLCVDEFRLNETNRIRSQFNCVGGKGTHVSVNLSLLGIKSIATGIVRGQVGQEIISSLCSEHINLQFIALEEGNSRINYVLIDNANNCTLISDKGQVLDSAELELLIRRYSMLVGDGDTVVISGDGSNQKRSIQNKLIDIALARNAKICLDTSGESLINGVCSSPFLIKPNLSELRFLCGRELVSQAEILTAMKKLADSGIQNIIVSCGSEGSLVYAAGSYYKVTAPQVPVKNTVGCGDALLAGVLAGFEQHLDIEANLKQATAVAAAAAVNETTVGFSTALISQLVGLVKVESI